MRPVCKESCRTSMLLEARFLLKALAQLCIEEHECSLEEGRGSFPISPLRALKNRVLNTGFPSLMKELKEKEKNKTRAYSVTSLFPSIVIRAMCKDIELVSLQREGGQHGQLTQNRSTSRPCVYFLEWGNWVEKKQIPELLSLIPTFYVILSCLLEKHFRFRKDVHLIGAE